ncbi:MAG: bifunctional UDP-N-acetylglucosamine diphosphorylase/glucosamine-1-phosphate N-acetyltransferase GlmU [Clostridia bacterium]|nr:bifunctional UDP-N-acetylglucosamine diphosphorylase/glucosamine-1-phosphate N-acetyltransferase GlmU [Clostridia bacterium]
MSFSLVVLAAGEGKRMKSERSKVVFKVSGREMVNRVIDEATKAGVDKVCVVVGHKAEMVMEAVGNGVEFATQLEQKGTGHAVMQAKEFVKNSENVMILAGDTPLITAETLKNAMSFHLDNNYSCTVLTAVLDNPFGYGRIIRDDFSNVSKIVEQKDATESEKAVREINSGMYCFKSVELVEALDKLTNNNAQGEYYLTDTLAIMKNAGLKVGAFTVENAVEISGVNDRLQLGEAEKVMRRRINEKHALNGVTIIDIDNTYIEDDVVIGQDTVIYPGTTLEKGTVIGKNVVIGQNCRIVNSKVGDGCDVYYSTMVDSSVDEGTHVGPYAYLRPNSKVGKGCKVGDFVELKNAVLGDGTKASHLTYIGDATVGANVNFGCGTVIVNYDGKSKHRTVIGDNAFIGCNSNLVSPVTVNNDAYIAAGSTITHEVPEGTLAIARSRQEIKTDWKDKRSK